MDWILVYIIVEYKILHTHAKSDKQPDCKDNRQKYNLHHITNHF